MISCIIPAAGDSRRMGSWKPLLPVFGVPMVIRAVSALLPFNLPIVLVTGYRGDELEALVGKSFPEVLFVRNRDYQQGMFSSVKAGLASLGPAQDTLIMPADLPLIEEHHIAPLLEMWEHTISDVLRPRKGMQPGHPVICSSAAVRLALDAPGQSSMQEVLFSLSHTYAELAHPAYYQDVDTPQEYRQLTL